MKSFKLFEKWLDKVLAARFPGNTAAINFNLYECGDGNGYEIELIASDRFNADSDDWACSEIYATRDNLLVIASKESWEAFLETAEKWIVQYLEQGKYRAKLLGYQAVALGFTEGDLRVVYRRRKRWSRFHKVFYICVCVPDFATDCGMLFFNWHLGDIKASGRTSFSRLLFVIIILIPA